MDAWTMSAGDFGFLRHFLTCLSFIRASLGGGQAGGCEDLIERKIKTYNALSRECPKEAKRV